MSTRWSGIGLALSISGLAVGVACVINRPWALGHVRDGAFFAYLAEVAARGFFPYRDVFSMHGFLHTGLGGIAVSLSQGAGLIVLGMLVHGLMTAAAILLAWKCLGPPRGWMDRAVAVLIAWGIATGWPFIGEFIVSGGRPKFYAIVLVSGGVLLLARRRPLFAGVSFATACVAWQPSIVLVLGSALGWAVARFAIWLGPDKRRTSDGLATGAFRTVAWVLGGVVATSVSFVGLLLGTGCWEGFVDQAIWFPLDHPNPRVHPGVLGRMRQVYGLLPLPVTATVAVGVGLGVVSSLSARFSACRREHCEDEIIARSCLLGWFTAYAMYLYFDLDARGDMVPLLVPAGALAGSAIGFFVGGRSCRVKRALSVVTALVGFWLVGGDLLVPYRHSDWVYKVSERVDCETVVSIRKVAGGRPVLIFADPLLQQALSEDPLHPYVFFEIGSRAFIQEREAGGLTAFVDRLVAKKPGAVVVGRRALPILLQMSGRFEKDYTVEHGVVRRGVPVWAMYDPQ